METGMATAVDTGLDNFTYPNLRDVDPNYTAIPEDVYTLKVIKLALAKTTGNNGKAIKPYVKGTFAVTNHDKHAARRLFHNFWNILESSSRDVKDLKKLADATGVQQNGSFESWLEAMTQEQPTFKVPVKQIDAIDFTTREVKLNPDGTTVKDNTIDFRNVEIA